MSTHSFMTESVEPSLPTVSSTPEPSRRYVQWKEEDVGLLLNDLEQPGHYSKWKENKSGYSKRVAEQVFKNVMYHEAIKFKVRWLEARFKIWNQNLTSAEPDEAAINNVREKMYKEFPYYDRCKPIFDSSLSRDSPAVQPSLIAPAEHDENANKSNQLEITIMKPEPTHMTNEPSSPTLDTYQHHIHYQQQQQVHCQRNPFNKRLPGTSTMLITPDTALKKRRRNQFNHSGPIPSTFYNSVSHNTQQQTIEDNSSEERRLKTMEFELELKKMDHQERMQEMKLEQLRLEIELQKLKRDTVSATVNNSD